MSRKYMQLNMQLNTGIITLSKGYKQPFPSRDGGAYFELGGGGGGGLQASARGANL